MRMPKSVWCPVAASCVLPGWGQWLLGHRKAALVWCCLWLFPQVLMLSVLFWHWEHAFGWSLLAFAVCSPIIILAAMVDTYRKARAVLSPDLFPRFQNPWVAVTLSFLIPGLGHCYLVRGTSWAWCGVVLAIAGILLVGLSTLVLTEYIFPDLPQQGLPITIVIKMLITTGVTLVIVCDAHRLAWRQSWQQWIQAPHLFRLLLLMVVVSVLQPGSFALDGLQAFQIPSGSMRETLWCPRYQETHTGMTLDQVPSDAWQPEWQQITINDAGTGWADQRTGFVAHHPDEKFERYQWEQVRTADRVLVNKFNSFINPLQIGDLVVFRIPPSVRKAYPDEQGKVYVKRVVALENQTFEITTEGRIMVDGEVLDSPPIFEKNRYTSSWGAYTREPRVIPSGHCLVLGDNSLSSWDGRMWGALPVELIIGKVVYRYWPPSRIGQVVGVPPQKLPASAMLSQELAEISSTTPDADYDE